MKNALFKYTITSLLFFSLILTADALQLTGRLEWVHKIEMRVLADGVINKVNVKIGQHVRKGHLLLSMDQREAKAELLKTKAIVARAIVTLDDANDELKRATELYDRGLIAEEELKDAKIKHIAAKAEKESAHAAQSFAEVALERTILRAPISGIIVTKNAYEGGVVYKTLQKEPLIAIAPSGKMLARLLVRTNVLSQYKPGQSAKVNVHGKIYNGKVYSQGVEAVRIEPGGAVYELDIIFNHSPKVLMRPSDVVTVVLP
jgi:multidrug efflux system membrane fusion protein